MSRLIPALLISACIVAAQPVSYNPQQRQQEEQNLAAKLQQDPNNIPTLLQMGMMKLQDCSGLHDDARSAMLDEAQSFYDRVVAIDPQNTAALYSLGVIGWSRVFPELRAARAKLSMDQQTPGPLPDAGIRAVLNSKYGRTLADSIADLERALAIDPQNNDSMAYMNLLYRSKADLEDTPEEARNDIAIADQWVEKTLATVRAKHDAGLPLNSQFVQAPPPPPPPPSPPGSPNGSTRLRVGGNVQAANLVQHVDPTYPPLALQARIQGTVRFNAIIAKDGTMANLTVLSGHPMLIQAALEAVRQWLYKPTLVNGEPAEVITTIEVNFTLP